jgi:hypothetical protein
MFRNDLFAIVHQQFSDSLFPQIAQEVPLGVGFIVPFKGHDISLVINNDNETVFFAPLYLGVRHEVP